MNDMKPHEHGDEGEGATHWACEARMKKEGGEAKCCECFPHDGCGHGLSECCNEYLEIFADTKRCSKCTKVYLRQCPTCKGDGILQVKDWPEEGLSFEENRMKVSIKATGHVGTTLSTPPSKQSEEKFPKLKLIECKCGEDVYEDDRDETGVLRCLNCHVAHDENLLVEHTLPIVTEQVFSTPPKAEGSSQLTPQDMVATFPDKSLDYMQIPKDALELCLDLYVDEQYKPMVRNTVSSLLTSATREAEERKDRIIDAARDKFAQLEEKFYKISQGQAQFDVFNMYQFVRDCRELLESLLPPPPDKPTK